MSMTLISTTTVGAGGASSITFSGISGTYTDLLIVVNARSASTDSVGFVRFNGLTTNLSCRFLQGDGSSVLSSADGSNVYFTLTRSDSDSNIFSNTQIYVPNYAGSTNKTISVDGTYSVNSSGASRLHLIAGLWASTAAITQVTLVTSSGNNFVQNSTVSLYGITKGSGGATVS